MKLKFLLALFIFAIIPHLQAFSQESKTPELDQILTKHYEALGGLERWQKLNTMTMKGDLSSSGTVMAITAYHMRPNKCRVEFKFEETQMAQVYNSAFAWQINPLTGNPDPTPMSRGRSNYFNDTCDIDSSLIDYEKKGNEVKLLGKEKVKGKEAYKISVKFKTGNIQTHFMDANTYLPIKVTGIYNIDGIELRTTTSYSDFRDSEGYVMPYNVVFDIHGAGSKETLKIDEFSFNTKIDPKIFDFPKEHMQRLPSKPK